MAESTRAIVTKEFGALEVKDAERGEVEAVIATLNVVDRDGDVILADAIKDGARVKMSSYGHDIMFGDMPVGRGVVKVEKDRAVFRGKVFLSTLRGREVFSVLKEMGADQEWSFGFSILDSGPPDDDWREKGASRVLKALDAFEVSPVLLGAGIGTATVSVKSAGSPDRAEAVDAALSLRNESLDDAERWWAVEMSEEAVITKSLDGSHFRVTYTQDGEGTVTLGDAVPVEVVFQPVEKEAESKQDEPDADGADAESEAAEARAAEEKAAAEAEDRRKARTLAAVEEYERVQRTLKRLRVA